MELMKQFKAQTVSSIGGFLRQLSERKDIEIQKCNFIKEMNEMTGVYIVANDKEAVVLAVDARQEDTDELVDECPFHGEEPQWFSTSNHRVSPIYLMRQVMSLLELCYRKADMSNIEIGGTLLSFSALTDTGHFENLFDQLNICVLDELNAKEDYLLLREHFVDGNSTQKVLKDLFSSYYLVGLPDLVHSDDYIPKQEEPTHQEDETPDFVLPALDGEELGDFEHDLQELFGSFESHDTPPEEHRASAQEPVDDARLESKFERHMRRVREALNEQYPSGPSGTCNIPSRVKIVPPMSARDANNAFSRLVGIGEIRAQIESLTLMSSYNRRRMRLNPEAEEHRVTLHALFTGNPGTGKSTVCKLYGAQLRQAGVLEFGHVVVVDRSSFIGNCWGDEEKSVRALLQLARGGVLMVDEAYQLLGDGHPTDPGRLVLPLMMNYLADPEWRDVAVVLCGYPAPMRKLLEQNTGLVSRFPHHFEFKDFDVATLEQITLSHVKSYGYTFAHDAWAKYSWFLREAYDQRDENWPNARFVTHWLENIYVRHGVRCERQDISDPEELSTLTVDDIPHPSET